MPPNKELVLQGNRCAVVSNLPGLVGSATGLAFVPARLRDR